MTRYRDDRFDRDDRHFENRNERQNYDRSDSMYGGAQSGQYDDRMGYGQGQHRTDYSRGQGYSYSQDDARSFGPRPSDTRFGMNADRNGQGYMDYDRGYSYDERQMYGGRQFGDSRPFRSMTGMDMSRQGRMMGRGYGNDQHYDWDGLREAAQGQRFQGQGFQGQGFQERQHFGYGEADYDAPQFQPGSNQMGQRPSQYGPQSGRMSSMAGGMYGGMYGQTSSHTSQMGNSQGYRQSMYQEQPYQSHQGKGPKGYQRSDDRIKESVNDALEEAHDVDASEIDVQVMNGEVTLTGTVNDRMQKRRAEEAVEHLRGVKDVHNQLRVQQQSQSGQTNGQVMSSLSGMGSHQNSNMGGNTMTTAGNQTSGTVGSSSSVTDTTSDSTKR